MRVAFVAPHWGEAAEVLAQLEGHWHFQREIPGQAVMSGSAIFTASNHGEMQYQEKGLLKLFDGGEFEAERGYLFFSADDGFTVMFDEKPRRLFHHVALQKQKDVLIGEASHVCGQDLYISRYEFLPDVSFLIRHRVDGPRKSYIATARYKRVSAT